MATATLVVGTNTYITLAEANTYFADRLGIDAWTNATDDNKNKALLMACKIIDDQQYDGRPVSIVQSSAFPRYGLKNRQKQLLPSLSTPDDVKYAQAEQALYILEEYSTFDASSERLQLQREGVTRIKINDYEEQYSGKGTSGMGHSLCTNAKERLMPYLRITFNGLSSRSYF